MLKIIKIGGNIVDNPSKLSAFLIDFAALEGPKILVHGGGKIATKIATALGIETVMVEGRRVTDRPMLDVVTMVYNGINKQIVSELQSIECDAAGLCGADGRLMISRKRPPVRVGGREVDYGLVGDPVRVNTAIVDNFINNGLTPVVAPITFDENARKSAPENSPALLNTNADTVASTLAISLAGSGQETELVYCFEHQGVMMDVDDLSSVIQHIDRKKFEQLKVAGVVDKGMIPKLENALRAVEKGVARVVICSAENLSRPDYGGTVICCENG